MDENKFKKFKKFLDTGKMTDKSGTKVNFNKLDKRIKTIDLETAKSPSPSKHNKGGLKGNQKKLDKNNNNRIDAQDFKILKAEKAKGRGMGLQDEKVKPGKVMKAKRGHFSKSNISGHSRVMGEAKDYKNYLKGLKQATMSSKAKKAGEAAAKVAKSTRLGKIALGVAGAGIAAKKFIESDKFKDMLKKKMNKKMGGGMMNKPMGYKKGKEIDYGKVFDKKFYSSALGKEAQLHADDYDAGLDRAERRAASETMALYKKNKKMGGGMMNKPMGYKSGTMVMARGCKLGRKKPTKIT